MKVLGKLLTVSMMLVLASPVFAGSWNRENGLAGMDYVHIYTPSASPAVDGKRALMINLHGCAQSADDFKNGNDWESVAESYGMVVAIPDVPGNGAADVRSDVSVSQCWDYYFANHTRNNRHNDNILSLVNNLLGRSGLNIDPDQVYISGLSSGGGETMIMGCLAPDVFAGVGINAGPTIGTGPNEIGTVSTTQGAAVNDCNNIAGGSSGNFQSQITSVVFGTGDYLVNQDYNRLNADVMADIYNASKDSGSNSIAGGGTEELWSKDGKKVVQLITVQGLGHAWPAGSDTSGGGGYIDHTTIDYPEVLTAFLFCNNRRTSENECDGGTEPPPPPPGDDCWTTTNVNHYNAGRAVQYGSGQYASYGAVGSYAWLGYGSDTTSLEETSSGYYEKVSSCN